MHLDGALGQVNRGCHHRLHVARHAERRFPRLPFHIGELVVRKRDFVGLRRDFQAAPERARGRGHIAHEHVRARRLAIRRRVGGRDLDAA